jgi:hypothetical protein
MICFLCSRIPCKTYIRRASGAFSISVSRTRSHKLEFALHATSPPLASHQLQQSVAGATSRPLIFRSLPAPHRTCTTAPRPRHLSLTPQLPCLCRVKSCQCHVSVKSCAMPHALRALSNSGPVKAPQLRCPGRFSAFPTASTAFQRFLSVSLLMHHMDYS